MRLSINGRVVKSYDVEVSTPKMVENYVGFQRLGNCLAVLSVGEEESQPLNQEYIESIDTSREQEAMAKASVLIGQAEAQAQQILAQAEAQAQQILAQAQGELEQLRQETIRNTREEVYPVAFADGHREGKLTGESEGKLLSEQAYQLFQLAQHAVQEEYAKVDQVLLHLAIKIAERLARASLAVDPQRLLGIIQALTLLPNERQGWRLHISPADVNWLQENQLPCPWVGDESLQPGDCFLECQEGIFDARLEAQLEKLEHTLREELEHGGMESVNPDGRAD